MRPHDLVLQIAIYRHTSVQVGSVAHISICLIKLHLSVFFHKTTHVSKVTYCPSCPANGYGSVVNIRYIHMYALYYTYLHT